MQHQNKIINYLRTRLFNGNHKLTRNWKPKLITLALAIVVWLFVEYRSSEAESEWDEEDIRIVVPEAN